MTWTLRGAFYLMFALASAPAVAAVATSAPEPLIVEASPFPSGDHSSEIERAWFGAGQGLAARARTARLRARELGADNLDAASRALIAPGGSGGELGEAMLAVRLAPDLPMARISLARAHWREGEHAAALEAALAGLRSIPTHLEASLWLGTTVLVMFATLLVLGPLIFIAVVSLSAFGHAAHDLGDLVSRHMPGFARVALLGCLLMVPLLLEEGVLGLVVLLFAVGFTYGDARRRLVLALASILLVLGLYPIARLAATAVTTIDADPVAVATLAVVQGIESSAELEILRAASDDDVLAEHAMAIHARRSGDMVLARGRYDALLQRLPRDPVVLTNVANQRFHEGDTESAIDLYERAAGLTASPVLMFNLSQAYARVFRMEEFETALQLGQSIDSAAVGELSQTGDPGFVADLAFPMSEIRDRLIAKARGEPIEIALQGAPFSGRLGSGWSATGGAFLLATVLAGFAGGRYEHSSTCTRCGRRICTRCDGTVWNSEICNGCHHLFHRPETTDPALRTARVAELRARERRIDRIATASALVVPGIGGTLARRPDLGLVGVLLFCGAVIALIWRHGVVPDPLAVGAVGSLVFSVVGGMAIFGYLLVVLASLAIRRNL